MNMEIEGFTPLQRELADRIWAIESPEALIEFFDLLPRNLLQDAYVVYKMIIETTLDDMDWSDCSEAHEVIERVRNLPC